MHPFKRVGLKIKRGQSFRADNGFQIFGMLDSMTSGDGKTVQAGMFKRFYFIFCLCCFLWCGCAGCQGLNTCQAVKRSGWIQGEKQADIFSGCRGPFFECKRIGYLLRVCLPCRVSRSSGLSALTVWQYKRKRASWILLIIHFQFFADALTVKRSGGQADIFYWCRYSIMVCVI